MTIRAMAVFAIFCTATPPPQANALFGDAFDLGGDLSIGNDDNNFDFDFGGIMDGVSDMMGSMFGDGGFQCMMECSISMISEPSYNMYINSCFNFDFLSAGFDFGSTFCEPACRRALFDYFTDFNGCWAACPSTGSIFDPSSMQQSSAAQMSAFTGCGGTTNALGDFTFSVSWRWSFTQGDPHFTTLDGASYTYNGKGDFWLVRDDTDNGIAVQVRIDECDGGTKATCIAGVAIATGVNGVNRHTVIVTSLGGVLQATVDGMPASSATDLGSAADTLTVGTSIKVESINGVKIDVTLDEGVIGVGVAIMSDLEGRVKGLYGNYDGDPTNDFQGSDGTNYDASSTDKDLFGFGESWRVASSDSLFSSLGAAPDHTGWTPTFASDIAKADDVTAKCSAAGLSGKDLANCEFDVQVSGDDKFVKINERAANFMVVKNTQETSDTFSNNALTGEATTTSGAIGDSSSATHITVGAATSVAIVAAALLVV